DIVSGNRPADVTVINSCSVTAEADRKCRQLVRRSLKANPDTFVVVTGCYAQLQPGPLAEMPGVDVVLGMKDKFRLFDVVSTFSKRPRTQVEVSCIEDVSFFESSESTARTRTFVKVQDGCDYSCSFCTIPLARGRSRSDSIGQVIDRVRRLADSGSKEVVLSGVNLGLFGADEGASLFDLLVQLDRVEDIGRFRISSIEPNLLTDEIVDLVAESERIVPHFHVPLQSGDDQVLGHMRRRYRTSTYADRVDYILKRCPDACIGADVIVGYPTETDEKFLNTFRFLQQLPIAYLHVFTYSPRPDTVAEARLSNGEVPPLDRRESRRRNGALRGLSESKRKAFYESQVGRHSNVLWEERSQKSLTQSSPAGQMIGHTDNYVKVTSPIRPNRLGTFESVQLVAIDDSEGVLTVRAEPASYGHAAATTLTP
ncbi:MAG: tRNA (N(6)-L-threonylcarbamoyladenosine(37)-C(2))-methylthiotransferase MtaB, partial [Rhodothermales bacterium]|nr:tRNA (N(6)-L-threonylcarbamoyladenosine(37)-C(2))-methylthiotransferase MtaB [Rhodothermales bacterium]